MLICATEPRSSVPSSSGSSALRFQTRSALAPHSCLLWRKTFSRALVDMFASDWEPLPKVLHVDFPGFQALASKVLKDPCDGHDEIGDRLQVCLVIKIVF